MSGVHAVLGNVSFDTVSFIISLLRSYNRTEIQKYMFHTVFYQCIKQNLLVPLNVH